MSQRQLSLLLHKSQSWIRDIERGRYPIKAQDVQLLASVLPDLMPNATDQQ
jgi:transcriptional regulator with XRE-family HTH domain